MLNTRKIYIKNDYLNTNKWKESDDLFAAETFGNKKKLRNIAKDCLEQAEKWSLIAKAGSMPVEDIDEDLNELPDLE
jgi:hypothetical protein